MLAIGRAMMARPEVMLLDEPSMGLAPLVVQQIFDVIKDINKMGTTVLLVEQQRPQSAPDCRLRLRHGDGQNRHGGAAQEVASNPDVMAAYLGGKKNSSHISTLTGCNTIQRKGAEKSAPFLMR